MPDSVSLVEQFRAAGPFLSGLGLFLASGAAWFTFYFISVKTRRDNWVQSFQELYREFWEPGDNAEVRDWIANDLSYEYLKNIILIRMDSEENDIERFKSIELDKLDKFLSIFSRLKFWRHLEYSKYQKIYFICLTNIIGYQR